MKRIAIFVDGSNFSTACNTVGFRPDFDKMTRFFARDGDVVGCFYFTAMLPRETESNLRKLTDRLQYNGWNLVSKEAKTYHETVGVGDEAVIKTKVKGNMDGEIIVQGFKMCEYISDLVLFSGDNDFRSAVEEWQVRGLRVTAVSVLDRSDPAKSMMGDELRRQVNKFVDLKEIYREMTLEDKERPPTIEYLRKRH